jgi:hypothetical protein
MAKRKRERRARAKAATESYRDPDGNVLVLRCELSPGTVAKLAEPPESAAASVDDAWQRREELMFERLAVSWEIAGLPLEEQKLLLGRYRMASPEERRWVRETIATHVERWLPDLRGPS